MLENNGFLRKQWGFFLENNVVVFKKAMFFLHDFTHAFFIIKHMHFIKIKTIHVLHKLSFHNTIPHRSHSLIGHVIQEL